MRDLRGDHAQMMLLTAFILLIGFVALAGMVARVSQLSDETGQESRRGTVLESALVLEGTGDLLIRLEALVPPGSDVETGAYLDAVDAAMEHMDLLQSGRGFRFQAAPAACTPMGPDAEVAVSILVDRADMGFEATVRHTLAGATCP